VSIQGNIMLRRFLEYGSKSLPYIACLTPLMERVFWPRKDEVVPSILELKAHMDTLHVSLGNVTAAIEEEQQRQDRLEHQCQEMKKSIDDLAHEQANLVEQVHVMAGWIRNAALAGLVLLTLFLVLKSVQIIMAIGH
jgi:hypothetical protein